MAKEFIYKAKAEGDFSSLTREVAQLNAQLAAARGSVNAFKEELEKNTKGQSEYKIVIRSEFDASGTKVAKAEVVQVNEKYEGLLRTLKAIEKEPQKNSLTSLRQQRNEAKQARDAISQYSSSFDGIGNKIRVINSAWTIQNEKVRTLQKELSVAEASGFWQKIAAQYDLGGLSRAGRSITDFVNVFQSLAIIVGQVQASINGVVNAVAGLQSFNLSFKAIEAGAAGGAQALSESSRIALNLGSDLGSVRQGFQQLSPVILNTGGTIGDVSRIVETLSSRFAAFGISGDRARRVTNGVIQAFAKGKLMAEELTQQISEADPAFKTDLAKALGYTTAKLEEQVKAGKITGKVLLENLPKLSKSALLYGKLGDSALDAARSLRTSSGTIDQVRNKIATLNQLSLERLAESIKPVLYAFIEVGASVADFIDRISKLAIIKSISAVLSALAGTTSTLIQTFLNATEGIIVFANAANTLVGPLLQIPGAAQLVAVALAAKLIGPLQGLKDQFLKNSAAASGFVGSIRALSTFSGLKAAIGNNLITPIKNFARLAAETSADANVGLKGTFSRIITGSLGTRKALDDLGAEQEKLASRSATVNKRLSVLSAGLENYRTKLLDAQKAASSGIVGSAAAGGIDQLTRKIGSLRAKVVDLQAQQVSLAAKTDELGKKKLTLAANMTFADRGFGALKTSILGVQGVVRGLYSLLGPLGIALVALGAATGAYQAATSRSNAILQESSERVEVLKKAIKDLGGDTSATEKPVTGLALAWLTFGNVVADVVDSISGLLDRLSTALQGVSRGVDGLASRFAIILGGAGLGALAGFATPLGPLGAAIGAVTGALIAFSLTGDAAAQKAKLITRSAKALKESFEGITPTVKALGVELDKLAKTGKVGEIGSDDRNKFIQGLEQEKSAIQELQRIYASQSAIETGLRKNKEQAIADTTKYRNAVIKLKDELAEQYKIAQRSMIGPRVVDKAAYQGAMKEIRRITKAIAENEDALTRAEAGAKSYNDQLYAAAAAAKLTKKEVDALVAANEQRRFKLGFASELDKAINSIGELGNEIKLLEYEVQNLDLLNPESLKKLDTALTKLEQFKFISEKLQRTKIQVEIEVRDLQQSIAESKLVIDLDPGPLREAALAVSKITNNYKDARVAFTQELNAINAASKEGVINEKKKKELIEESALKLVKAAQESRAALVDASREFRKQLEQARSAYQGLLLDKPEFFTPGEIKQNARQIEKDFTKALEKVRKDTGDWSWGPKLEGKTYDELLKQMKAFTDARKEADDLKNTIKSLNKTLELLARVLAKLAGLSLKDLEKLKLDPKELINKAEKAQSAITGIGVAGDKAAKAYGKVIKTSTLGGIEMVQTTNKATGAVEWLTKKEYEAAKGADALGTAGSNAAKNVKSAAEAAAKPLAALGDGSKEVIGEYLSGNKKLFLVQDTFTGKTEEMTQSQLDQAGVVNTLNSAYGDLGISISTATRLTGEYLKKQQEQNALLAPGTQQIADNIGIDPNTSQNVIDAAKTAGGDYLKTLSETISKGQIFAPMVLSSFANAAADYKFGLEGLATAQAEAKAAQEAFNAALNNGGGDIIMAGARLANANSVLESAEYFAENAATAFENASSAAKQLGVDMDTVILPGTVIEFEGPKTLEEAYRNATDALTGFKNAEDSLSSRNVLGDLTQSSDEAEVSLDNASTALVDGSAPAMSIAGSLETGATAADDIANSLNDLDGKTIKINITTTGIPGLWTGGPASPGTTYRVNELGKEGFLSNSGRLTEINRPRNALWSPTTSGTVIPAHVMRSIEVPKAGISVTGSRVSKIAGSMHSTSGSNALVRELRRITQTDSSASLRNEIATSHASQTMEIGRLTRAVRELVDKDWNVNVKVRNNGGTAYMNALNRLS